MQECNIRKIRPGRTPLHIQLADIIRSQIESGVFSAGDQLPTEADLMKQHELSSSTVRQAELALVGEGLLYRRAGKGRSLPSVTFAGTCSLFQDFRTKR
ncbi:GntR family transcriptional regulator [Mesorhizobium sp. 131-2-5]|uniref:GntR family transcriptional regulator n=1 Tax=unclassified Mesorhizobium TaxID=325217 RepID=UPI00406C775F